MTYKFTIIASGKSINGLKATISDVSFTNAPLLKEKINLKGVGSFIRYSDR